MQTYIELRQVLEKPKESFGPKVQGFRRVPALYVCDFKMTAGGTRQK